MKLLIIGVILLFTPVWFFVIVGLLAPILIVCAFVIIPLIYLSTLLTSRRPQ